MAETQKASEPAPKGSETVYTLTVDYSIRPTADLRNDFDYVSDVYTEGTDWQRDERCKDVPTDGERAVTLELVHLNKSLTTKQILSELDAKGLRPAILEEYIAFARKQPDFQRQFPIAAFGSSCLRGGHRRVPWLYWHGAGRDLRLSWAWYDWSECWRFLAVRKEVSA